MIVSGLVEFANLSPLVLRYFVHFTFLCGLIWIFRANSEQKVLSSVLKSLMEVSKLMARASIDHVGTTLSLISLLINDKAVVGNNCADFIFFLLATDAEDLVMYLDARKVFRQNL